MFKSNHCIIKVDSLHSNHYYLYQEITRIGVIQELLVLQDGLHVILDSIYGLNYYNYYNIINRD